MDLTLEAIAVELGVSRQRLGSLFKDQTGLSFGDFLRLVRMEAAQRMLQDPGNLIKQIAHGCGYSATANFDRDFHLIFGVSPTEHRKDLLFQRERKQAVA